MGGACEGFFIATLNTQLCTCRQNAQGVKVPEEIINLLSDVRTYLQDKCEPPVYVSDRRLVKAVAIMQVSVSLLQVASMLLQGEIDSSLCAEHL